ncbi:hypothetical protein NDU88_002984 [Pleurodeles waltl]|uniref:Uncharacterized protein n=1 Tax=Pleurodeles waltl TaxID=8319 RepID=A0AAV7MR75_PLEWA|nr:hypothetical protein NDU88_002984 [Pleurodeles waltl]
MAGDVDDGDSRDLGGGRRKTQDGSWGLVRPGGSMWLAPECESGDPDGQGCSLPNPGLSDLPQTQKRKRRPRSLRRKPAASTGPPTEQEVQRGRLEPVVAAASLSGPSLGHRSTSRGSSEDGCESDRESLTLMPFSEILLVVTPGTADKLI